MKKYLFSLMGLCALAATLTGCDSDDVTLGPDEADLWLHPYSASSADQSLQTKFYGETGIYLLFNDTLRKQQVATNPDGTPFYDMETVDLNYYMIGSSGSYRNVFSYDYLTTDADKQAATTFVQQQVLPCLSGSLLPFSLLLVEQISQYAQQYSYNPLALTNPLVYAGYRCTAIAAGGVADMSDAEKLTLRNNILQAIINAKLPSLPDDAFDAFYAPCAQYYSTYLMGDGAATFFETHPTPMDIGLLDNSVSYYAWRTSGSLIMYNIAAKSYDLKDYTTAVFTYSDEAFAEKYGQYPIVMEKFKLLKQIFAQLGVTI
ncbi:MAG: hypothetical protein IJ551_01355 [Prevotella sp.]|nr:hypothetical protein [Prevotella sp.]